MPYTAPITMTKKEQAERQTLLTVAHRDFAKGLNVHAFFKVGDQATGQDLVQDTFIKTWAYLVKGGKIDMMKAFLYHILNHLIIDEYRKKKATSLDVLLEKGFEPSAGDFSRIFDVMDGKAAFLLIQRLPEKDKKVMRMHYLQDFSLKEMSLVTGRSKNALAVQVHRSLKKLKLLYEHKI